MKILKRLNKWMDDNDASCVTLVDRNYNTLGKRIWSLKPSIGDHVLISKSDHAPSGGYWKVANVLFSTLEDEGQGLMVILSEHGMLDA